MRAPEALHRRSQAAISDLRCSRVATRSSGADLDHIQPAGVLGDVVELEPAQDPSGFAPR